MAVILATRVARPRWWPGVAAWTLWTLAMLSLPVVAWLDQLSRRAGRPDVTQLSGGLVEGPVLGLVSATTVGAVLASRRPRHPVGWLLLILGLSLAASGVAAAYTAYGLVARPGALPAAGAVVRYAPALILAVLPALSFVLLLTPTGSLPSARWRWWAWVTGTAPVVLLVALVVAQGSLDPRYQAENSPLDFRGLGGALLVVNQLALGVTLLTVMVAAASLVVWFRRARGIARQQLRWVAWAAVLVVLAAAIALASAALGLPETLGWATGICVALLPLAIGAAILRYRLYDLDRILSRTLSWGLLTVLLGGGYAVVVLGLGQLLGRDSSLVVAGATLAVAALFQPARRRVQAVWIGGSTGAATTRPGSSRGSVPTYATRSTSTPSRLTCWRWSTRPCSRPRHRCGFDRPTVRPRTSAPLAHPERLGSGRLPGPFAQPCETGL